MNVVNSRSVALELNGTPYAALTDPQGSIKSLVNTTEAFTYKQTAFGEPLTQPALFNPWQYVSKRLDPETNFIYFGKRYYDPTLGRWLTPDPPAPSLYQYLLNNPYRYTDPDGQFAIFIPIFTVIFGAEIAAVMLPTAITITKIALPAAVPN